MNDVVHSRVPASAASGPSEGARVRARRRLVFRVGFVALFALTAISALTACIFEEGTYKGGGRIDHGGEAKTAEPPATTSEPTSQPTGTSTGDAGIGFPYDQ